MKKKLSIALAAVFATGSILAGCSNSKSEGEKNKSSDQVLNILEKGEIPSLDTSKATDGVSFGVFVNTNEGLYRLDKDNKPTPGVAESVDISEDKKTYTFKLRESKWSNGDAVTAHDFVYSWQRAVDPNTASEYAFILNGIKNAAAITKGEMSVDKLGVEAKDDSTLVVSLSNPVPYFLELTSFPTYFPLNEKFVTEKGKDYALEADAALYNGPFVMSDWTHEQGYTLKKNSEYWDEETVKLEKINVKMIKDTATAVNLYKTDKVDRIILDSENVEQFKDSDEFHTYIDPRVHFMKFNQTHEVFANEKVRLAFSLAYEKTGITEEILNDGSIPANGLVPKGFVTGPDGDDFREKNGDLNTFDADKAKQLWAEAKKELGKDSIKVEMLNFNDAANPKIGEYIKEQLESNLEGLEVIINQQPFKQKIEAETKMDYEFSLSAWGPDYPDAMTFMDLFLTDSPFNGMKYSNELYDQLVTDANGDLLTDLPVRFEALLEAEKVLLSDAAISPIFQRGFAFVEKKRVKGVVKQNFGGDYSYKWTYIE